MKRFYDYFLSEAEAPGVIDADADPSACDAQITDASFKIISNLRREIRRSSLLRQAGTYSGSVKIKHGGEIHRIPIYVDYDKSNTRGLCYFDSADSKLKRIVLNAYYYDEDDWSDSDVAKTMAHEITHAVDDLKGLVDKPATYSKFAKGNKYYFNSYEVNSFFMDIRTHLESKLRGFTHEGTYVDPEAVVKYLKEYVRISRELVAMERRKTVSGDYDQYMSLLRRQEIVLSVMLFGSTYRDLIMRWRKTPVFVKFIDYLENLALKWEKDFV